MDLEELSVGLSPVTFRLTLIIMFLLFVCSPVEGQWRVIGLQQPIVAAPGDDVILPCHVEPQVDVTGLTVEWSRTDFQPDPNDRLFQAKYVHLYRDAREVLDMKISSYVQRTTLFTDGLRRGNISLKIINVTLADEGRYKCFIPKIKSQSQYSFVHLIVVPHSTKTWTTETPLQPRSLQTPDPMEETDFKGGLSSRNRLVTCVIVCLLLIPVLAVGVTLHSRQKSQKQNLMPAI